MITNEDIDRMIENRQAPKRLVFNKATYEPLATSPHTLIAGTTGSGKSVLLNNLLIYLNEVRPAWFVYFDLKRVELTDFRDRASCHGYVTEPEDVLEALDKQIDILDYRFSVMKGKKSDESPLYIVIDELADMVTINGVLERLVKIGRLGRAANIHLLCATQDPSRRTLSAQLMQNFTCTVALRCRSAIESNQIVGVPGAEKLPKHGRAIRWDADGIEEFEIPLLDPDAVQMYHDQVHAIHRWTL